MTPRSDRHHVRMAIIGIVLIVVATALVFVKPSSFGGKREVSAIVRTANQIRTDAPVRLGGLDVGKVTAIEPGPGDTTRLRLQLDDDVDLHADARIAIKPRLILEGNAALDLDRGTRSAPRLPDGGTIPLQQTSVPVQLDQVLSTFDAPTRRSLQDTLGFLSTGLGGPSDRSGAKALRRAVREFDRSLDGIGRVADAARGTTHGDLERAVRNSGELTEQLAADPRALGDLVTNYARVSATVADQDAELTASVRSLASVLRVAPNRLRRIDAALPAVTRAARDLRPALRVAPSVLRSTDGLLRQVDAITSRRELPRTLTALDPVLESVPRLTRGLTRTAPRLTSVTECLRATVLPAIKQTIPDGSQSTGDPVWLDALHAGASLAASSPNFDGNGTTIRLGVTESDQSAQGFIPGLGRLEGSGDVRGMSPEWLGYGNQPPSRPDLECSQQRLPDLGARNTTGPDSFKTVTRTGTSKALESELSGTLRRLLGLKGWGDLSVPEPRTSRKPRPRPTASPTPRPTATAAPSRPAPTPTARPSRPRTPVDDVVQDTLEPLLDNLLDGLPPQPTPGASSGTGLGDTLDGLLGRGR